MKNKEQIQEREVQNKAIMKFFSKYDWSVSINQIDMSIKDKRTGREHGYYLWAESKAKDSNIIKMLTQLIITIGKARIYDRYNPPPFLGCLSENKIAFIPYANVIDIFARQDINWKITPSDHGTAEFGKVYNIVLPMVENNNNYTSLVFDHKKDEKELKEFIATNFILGQHKLTKIQINRNNFVIIYNRWLENVKPTIQIDWQVAKQKSILDLDFYLADIFSRNNETFKESLHVILKIDKYLLDRYLDEMGLDTSKMAMFNDGQEGHKLFWANYERPPLEEFWKHIEDRRDLLVPQDIREIKGSFYTPSVWVEKAQEYIASQLGDTWQDDYYVWDCAAGTGNLLAGLMYKEKIFASTIDKADVAIMKDRIKNGAKLLDKNTFQFDFLEDTDWSKLPLDLRKIVEDPKKRKKLLIFINPPYREQGNIKEITGTGSYKRDIPKTKIANKYAELLGTATRELFIQFLIRIAKEIPGCIIAEFSKLKAVTGAQFFKFRANFQPKFLSGFVVPAYTFDNVQGKFPIGFKIWDTAQIQVKPEIALDVYNELGTPIGTKTFYMYKHNEYFSNFVNSIKLKSGKELGWVEGLTRNDFSEKERIFITDKSSRISVPRGMTIYDHNLLAVCVCFAVRMSVLATWLNDKDQYLTPNDKWKMDAEFITDCLAYTLFHEKNRFSSREFTNHWIPFTESAVDAKGKFDSNFMTNFFKKGPNGTGIELFDNIGNQIFPLEFSHEAEAAFAEGEKIWKLYHRQPKVDLNASLEDMRQYFKTNADITAKSDFVVLEAQLKSVLEILEGKIEPSIYGYNFLKE